jgi:hypothetical protein
MTFNKYAQYPTEPGLILVKDRFNSLVFAMESDNCRARIESKDKEHLSALANGGTYPTSWNGGRPEAAFAAGILIYDVIAMPGSTKAERSQTRDLLERYSLAKKLVDGA